MRVKTYDGKWIRGSRLRAVTSKGDNYCFMPHFCQFGSQMKSIVFNSAYMREEKGGKNDNLFLYQSGPSCISWLSNRKKFDYSMPGKIVFSILLQYNKLV